MPAAARSRAMPVDAEGVGPVRRHRDVDDRIVEPGIGGIGRARPARRPAGRRCRRDSSEMPSSRSERSMPFDLDAADDAFLEVDAGAGNVGPGGREDADHAGRGRWARRRPPGRASRRRDRRCRRAAGRRSGCFSAEITRAIRNGANALPGPRPLSTSRPIMVSLSAISSAGRARRRCRGALLARRG